MKLFNFNVLSFNFNVFSRRTGQGGRGGVGVWRENNSDTLMEK